MKIGEFIAKELHALGNLDLELKVIMVSAMVVKEYGVSPDGAYLMVKGVLADQRDDFQKGLNKLVNAVVVYCTH